MSLYPHPNQPTITASTGLATQFIASQNRTQFARTFDIRIDHKIADKDNIFGRYTQNNVSTFTPANPFPKATAAGVTMFPGSGLNGPSPDVARNIQVNYAHTFTPQLLLTAGIGYTFINNLSLPITDGLNPNTAFGQPGINFNKYTTGLGPISVGGGTSSLGSGGNFIPLNDKDNTYQANVSVIYSKGNHAIKVGAALIRRLALNLQDNQGEGSFSFAGLPELTTGFFSSATRNNNLNPPNYRIWETSGYVADDWHASQKLTLNIGVRYDVFTPFVEKNNHISNIFLDPNGISHIDQAGVNGVNRAAGEKIFWGALAPRLGFAYTVSPKTVIRGGFGLAYYPGNATSTANMKNQPNAVTFGICTSATAGTTTPCPAQYKYLQNGLPVPVAPPAANLVGAGLVGAIPDAQSYDFRLSVLDQFNLTLQQQILGSTLTVSYVGELGRHLYQVIQINRVPLANTITGTNPATGAPILASGSGATSARIYAKTLPNVTTIGMGLSQGASSFNALQASLERRFAHGLGFNANTTWMKNMDNISAGGGSQNLLTRDRDDWGNSSNDQPNRIVVSGNYSPTWGSFKGYKGALINGWQLNLINVWATGGPLTVTNQTNVSNTDPGAGADRPNQIANPMVGAKRTASNFFNTKAFVAQAPGTLGNERGGSMYGPHFRHLDVSIFKNVTVYREAKMQFRAEMFNVANQSNLGNPATGIGGGTFGTITGLNGFYNPRLVQFAVRLTF
jgi:hypothetical protein